LKGDRIPQFFKAHFMPNLFATIEGDLSGLVRRLTPAKPFCDSLDHELLHNLCAILRGNPELSSSFYEALQTRAKSASSQVRFLCFQLTHYVFCRSAHFRAVLCRSLALPFLDCFRAPLPAPESFATRLTRILPYVLDQWSDRFGKLYPQLNVLKTEFDDLRERTTDRTESLGQLVSNVSTEYQAILTEMANLVELLRPQFDDLGEVMISQEYRDIVLSAMRENRGPLRECLGKVDELKARAFSFPEAGDLTAAIAKISDQVAVIEAAAVEAGLDDDEFVDVSEDE
jgi:hypothetical protein